MAEQIYSEYYESLEGNAKVRYREKLALMGDITDPYIVITMTGNQNNDLEWHDWPEVQYPDIYNYLIATPSQSLHKRRNESLQEFRRL